MSDPRVPKYMEAIRNLAAQGQMPPGELTIVGVYHDDWCSLLAGTGACDCEPEVQRDKAPEA